MTRPAFPSGTAARAAVLAALLGTPAVAAAPAAGVTLRATVAGGDVTSLRVAGRDLLAPRFPGGPEPFAHTPVFTGPDGGTRTDASRGRLTVEGGTAVRTFPWGAIRSAASVEDGRLVLRLEVENASPEPLASLALRWLALRFPAAPGAAVVDTGMWGNGGVGKLGTQGFVARSATMPPVVALRTEEAQLFLCADDAEAGCGVGVPHALDPGERRIAPLVVYLEDLPPGGRRALRVSLRAAPPGPVRFRPAAGDVLDRFAARYPFTVDWEDRRPIGMLMPAGSGVEGEWAKVNPRRWSVVNGGRFDITTPGGRAAFREGLLAHGRRSVEVLREVGAQGMIVWDVEGQQIGQTFYGEPHMIGELAPEMEEPAGAAAPDTPDVPLVDAFFRLFRDAGLRTGVLLRPQEVYVNPEGYPCQRYLDTEGAWANLRRDLVYARDRWGCTLFYIDSTVDQAVSTPLDPSVLARLHREFPGVLLLPENQALRYYGCSAPLDSYVHHGVTRTAPKVREVWPRAFSFIMADGGLTVRGSDNSPAARAARRAELVDGVRRGDILMVSGWYLPEHTREITAVYRDARKEPATP